MIFIVFKVTLYCTQNPTTTIINVSGVMQLLAA